MKQKIFSLLVLLLTAATGAWAQTETYSVKFEANGNSKTIENVTLPYTFWCDWENENGELDGIIKELYGLSGGYCDPNATPSASGNSNVTAGKDGKNQYITISAPFGGTATVTGTYRYANGATMNYELTISIPGYVAPAGTTVNLTRGTGDKANEWTMVGGMPAGNVTVNVEYWPGMLTLPAASEGGTVTLEGVTSNTIIDENFDDYTAGGKMAQTANAAGNSNWTTWSNAPGGGEDGTLATLNDNTCLQVNKDNDQVLLLGDKTSGMWEYSFDVYVPEGKFGYFNLLHDFAGVNSTWAFQCYLNANWEYDGENTSITYSPGHGTVHAGSTSTADLPCVVNEWMHVSIVIDIDNDLAKLFFNGDFICEWQWSLDSYGEDVVSGKLAACNFFGEGDEYYVDNIKFTQISLPAGFERDGYGNIYVESGTQINLVTTPAENYHLASLSDGTNTYNVDNDGKVTITMPDADLTLTAEFAENTYNVTFAEGVNPEAPADPVWTATPSTGVKKDDKVTVTYSGDRKVIGVRAEKKAEHTK